MNLRGALAAWVMVAFFAGCGSAAPASPTPTATPSSGIRALVLLSPTCPVQQVGQPPCETPYAAEFRVTRRGESAVLATIRSGNDGKFELPLAPGDYVVTPTAAEVLPAAAPVDVTVEPGRFTEIQIDFDSGIR